MSKKLQLFLEKYIKLNEGITKKREISNMMVLFQLQIHTHKINK